MTITVTNWIELNDLSNGERQAVVEGLNSGKVKVLVATMQVIGEEVDAPALSTCSWRLLSSLMAVSCNTWGECCGQCQ